MKYGQRILESSDIKDRIFLISSERRRGKRAKQNWVRRSFGFEICLVPKRLKKFSVLTNILMQIPNNNESISPD